MDSPVGKRRPKQIVEWSLPSLTSPESLDSEAPTPSRSPFTFITHRTYSRQAPEEKLTPKPSPIARCLKQARLKTEFDFLTLEPLRPNWLRSILRREYWVTQWMALFLSASILMAMVAVLHQFDGQVLDAWPLSPITLNALLSFFTAVLWILLTEIFSTCTDQLCWLRFHEGGLLSEFDQYSRATRSIFSNLKIVLSPRKSYLLRLAAVSYMTMTVAGPFVQQILDVQLVPAPVSTNGQLPTTFNLTKDCFNMFSNQSSFQKAVYTGILASDTADLTVKTTCSTGNCSWSDYESFVVRANVRDVSADLLTIDNTGLAQLAHNFSLPPESSGAILSLSNPPFLGKPSPLVRVGSMIDIVKQGMMGGTIIPVPQKKSVTVILQGAKFYQDLMTSNPKGQASAIIYFSNFTFSGDNSSTGLDNAALQYNNCAAWRVDFDVCLQAFYAEETNGHLLESPQSQSVCLDQSPTDVNSLYNLTFNNRQHVVRWSIIIDLFELLQDEFEGNATMYSGVYTVSGRATGSLYSRWSMSSTMMTFLRQPISNAANSLSVGRPDDTIEVLMDRMAGSISNYMRTVAGNVTTGTVFQMQAVYTVTWVWMTIPASTLVMVAALLCATIWSSSRKDQPVWTDSALAIMVHGIDGNIRDDLLSLRTLEELGQASKQIKVRLSSTSRMLEKSV